MRGYAAAGRIKVLYEKGPDAIGAWHPPGYSAMQLREAGIQIYHACSELKVSTTGCYVAASRMCTFLY